MVFMKSKCTKMAKYTNSATLFFVISLIDKNVRYNV